MSIHAKSIVVLNLICEMSNKKWLLILIPVLLILLIIFLYFWLPQQKAPSEQIPEETTTPSQTYTDFEGELLSATIPENWTVVEYQDGAGTDMLVSGQTYTGLTGLEVKNPADVVVFSLKGVYGIGGIGGCQTYFRFADDSTTYYNDVVAANAEVGIPTPTVVDLTTATFSEINLFDAKVRRVATELYWDTDPVTSEFEAACGIQENIFDFGAPQFTISSPSGPVGAGIYQFSVLETATEEELTQLDDILDSLEIL